MLFSPRSILLLHILSTVLANQSTCHRHRAPSFESSNGSCSSPPEPYVIKPSPGRGLGVFASHNLEIGDVIIREPPIIRIPRPDYVKGSGYPIIEVTSLVRNEFAQLSPAQQTEVMRLSHHSLLAEREKVGGDILGFIFRTNAYNTGKDFGLFPKIARINHSCRPNAAYYWSETLNRRIVYATRPIVKGEEIFDSYIPLLLSREERQRRLNQYGFGCTCTVCTQPPASLTVSDERRADISAAFRAFETQLTLDVPTHPSSIRKARKNADSSLQLAKLVKEEGLADYYAMAYKIAAISHARVADWETASIYANEAYKLRVMEDPESTLTRELYVLTARFIKSWEEQLQKH